MSFHYENCHKERLLRLNLHTLKYRRLRGDMIEVFKIVHNVYDNRVAPSLLPEVTSSSYRIGVLIITLEKFSFLQEQ